MFLSELTIQNFALIESAQLRFGLGLNVLTGETGAGKSIILDAINLVLGGRASSELIRSGEEAAHVEARFSPHGGAAKTAWLDARLQTLGLEPDPDGELVVRRTLAGEKSSKNRITVNGQMTTRASLLELARGLIDLCGQQEHQILLNPENHRLILDNLVSEPKLLKQMEESWVNLNTIWERWSHLTSNQTSLLQQRDFLAFQIREIEDLAPKAGEDQALTEELKQLAHAEELIELAGSAQMRLEGEENAVVAGLHAATLQIRKAARHDKRFENIALLLDQALLHGKEAVADLGNVLESLDADPARLQQVENRLSALHQLQKKHGKSLEAIVEHLDAMRAELADLNVSEEDLSALKKQGEAALQTALAASLALHKARQKTAKSLRQEIQRELGDLAMKGAEFDVGFTEIAKAAAEFPCSPHAAGLARHGAHDIQFLLAPNVGEGLRPMHEIASGGELSRILLAIKCILSPAEFTGTYLFDEIDTGIGGTTGTTIGKKLKALSAKRQVVAITHLPQIASFADLHLQVAKAKHDGRTRTLIEALDKDARIEELARMLGGGESTKTARAHAVELLNQSRSRTP